MRSRRLRCLTAGLLLALAAAASRAEEWASLATDSGPPLFDFQIAYWINEYFEDGSPGSPVCESNMVLVFTECYAGDMLDDFDGVGPPGSPVFSRSTGLAAGRPGQQTDYGGYDDDAAAALAPGNTAGDVHAAGIAGKSEEEQPTSSGLLDRIIGGNTSTHVLIWAGDPNEDDFATIDSVVANFVANPSTTISVLAGNGPGEFLPATAAQLEATLAEIGALMDDGVAEQFVMYVTDHGNLEVVAGPPPPLPPGGTWQLPIDIDPDVLEDWLSGQGNHVELMLFVPEALPDPGKFDVELNGVGVGTIGQCQEAWEVTLPGGGLGVVYIFETDGELYLDEYVTIRRQLGGPSALPGGAPGRRSASLSAERQLVTVTSRSPTTTAVFSHVALGSGHLPKRGDTCTNGRTSLCLQGSRFQVEARFRTATGLDGLAEAVPISGDTGYFWFFNDRNVELIVKVLDGCGVNDRFWVFAGGLTNVEVTLTVTDRETGLVRTYENALDQQFSPLQDTSAFATCPGG